ncbi:MAG: hypothetical protein O3B95_05750 [Chloroflexi bacterium]|nr:hypothetical protein [Chloroflexota bacterium]
MTTAPPTTTTQGTTTKPANALAGASAVLVGFVSVVALAACG